MNFPVSNSVLNGSDIGSRLYKHSRCRINSCCSYRATARWTSNLRANKNLTAVAGVTFLRLTFDPNPLTKSMNCLTACNEENN